MENTSKTYTHPSDKHYTSEKHTQILIALLKAHGIRKIVASPGATNVCFVGSLQSDPYFEIYSSVDERSAAYIACGLAKESGEPVVLSCTGATASRNYPAGLTEAYYSNLPILAVTSTQFQGRVGHLIAQVIDRSSLMKDIAKKSIQIQEIHTKEEEWSVESSINDALLELRRHGGGPVHINLMTSYSKDFSVKELPKVRVIHRHFYGEAFPQLKGRKILVCVGSHVRWTERLTNAVDEFCELYDAAVICEHISNYRGKYGIYPVLIGSQEDKPCDFLKVDVMIHIGNILGLNTVATTDEVWRVHPDGEVRDTFKRLTNVFEMDESQFFECYVEMNKNALRKTEYYTAFQTACMELENKIPELPFSNPWIAKTSIPYLPKDCQLYLGILNTLRSWSYYYISHDSNITIYSNTGGFGTDGLVSSLLGASLTNPDKIYFGIIGDLAFFYDMNALGNRHVGNNFRLLVINNGRGTEFRNYNHLAERFGEAADPYIAAAGHYGYMSQKLVRHYAEDLGYKYLSARNKEEYLAAFEQFFTPEKLEQPVLFEVFTDSEKESEALKLLHHLDISASGAAKNLVRGILGEKGVSMVKKILN
ncbi:MAG TPA: 2-succinyl-5-enolpyruvyl-6-hydroxy-3-cyclohexene-1-carboxylate synthase [Candidatus Merdisoma merdipullorum]|nr:2-succinyl-5-enolpyruvyl-6-hydroxy-3-cyclohexene-1-carboxylate synthase [Candidatus Merdisoma merdipullorum]